MSGIFITGGTGYLGSYVLDELRQRPEAGRLFLLTRAKDAEEGTAKLWKALQLHLAPEEFYAFLDRVVFVPGDLSSPQLGMSDDARARVAEECDSVLHIAASLNRKSAKACFNANLRGSLSVAQLTRWLAERRGGLRRFSFVSTTAVAGKREHQVVKEDEAIDWALSDYDPYARTKKFAEHMFRELLPDVPKTILRPPTVMGDHRFPQTTQFDMVRILCWMLDAPAVPCHPDTRLDFVPASFVGPSIAKLHLKDDVAHDCYQLSAGTSAATVREVERAFREGGIRTPKLVPRLYGAFDSLAGGLANGPRGPVSLYASLIKVFLPYFTNDVVFDNTRVVTELGEAPARFTDYGVDLYRWSKSVGFEYPYAPLPARPSKLPEAAE